MIRTKGRERERAIEMIRKERERIKKMIRTKGREREREKE